MKNALRAALVLSSLIVVPMAGAQSYPTKPVRIFSPWAAGGPGDVVTRGAAQELSAALGQPYVVETRVGADGMIVGEAGSKTAPDGYNLTGCDQQVMAINPFVHAGMPYQIKDLAAVVHYGFLASAIHVAPTIAANTLPELLDMARAKPGSISWGSVGSASASNFSIEWLKNTRGSRIPFFLGSREHAAREDDEQRQTRPQQLRPQQPRPQQPRPRHLAFCGAGPQEGPLVRRPEC